MKRWSILSLLLVVLFLAVLLQGPSAGASSPQVARAPAATVDVSFVEKVAEPFGSFNGVPFVRYTGLFEGETSLGEFRVPYEIIAPADPGLGAATVLVEPPHWYYAPWGRDWSIGQELIFSRGISYASVGFGTDGFNILDASVPDTIIAGDPVENPGQIVFAGVSDEEILIQFVKALTSETYATEALGQLEHTYAYGISQTADFLLETLHRVAGSADHDLFDLTVLHNVSWKLTEPGMVRPGGPFELIDGQFAPLENVGRVLIVEAEGDLLNSESEQLRLAADRSDYRVYEVAGTAHLPTADNPLDHWRVARAILVAGDEWIRLGTSPPASSLIEAAPDGQIDPVYNTETGIARDGDLNAKGGVRLPDLYVGRAQFIASDLATAPGGFTSLAPHTGSTVDLACEPEPGSEKDEPRFRNHGEYVNAFVRQVNRLQEEGFLLEADADVLKLEAAEVEAGKPGTCPE